MRLLLMCLSCDVDVNEDKKVNMVIYPAAEGCRVARNSTFGVPSFPDALRHLVQLAPLRLLIDHLSDRDW